MRAHSSRFEGVRAIGLRGLKAGKDKYNTNDDLNPEARKSKPRAYSFMYVGPFTTEGWVSNGSSPESLKESHYHESRSTRGLGGFLKGFYKGYYLGF